MRKKSKKDMFIKKTISLPPDIFKIGDKAAKNQGRPFSNYVTQLILSHAK